MIQLSRDPDCQYKTAFVLAHKLREAMALEVQTGEILDGHVEIDGAKAPLNRTHRRLIPASPQDRRQRFTLLGALDT